MPTARPKTPSSARPKTPASGLFAPTAASSAKSRNAQAASTPPTPVKKSRITSASDRLSKPTAASLSRARTPVAPVPQSTRSNTKSTATTRTPTKTILKAADASTSAKNSSSVQKSVVSTTLAADVPNAGGASIDVADLDVDEKQEPMNGHAVERHSEDVTSTEEAVGQVSQLTESEEHEIERSSDKSAEDVQPESDADASIDLAKEDAPSSPLEVPPEPKVGIVEEQLVSEQESRIDRGDDIENLVNLLESASVSKARPVSIASIPDEVHEIPDEE